MSLPEMTPEQELDAVLEMANSTGWRILVEEGQKLFDAEGAGYDQVDNLLTLGQVQGFRRALAWFGNFPEALRATVEQAQEDNDES